MPERYRRPGTGGIDRRESLLTVGLPAALIVAKWVVGLAVAVLSVRQG